MGKERRDDTMFHLTCCTTSNNILLTYYPSLPKVSFHLIVNCPDTFVLQYMYFLSSKMSYLLFYKQSLKSTHDEDPHAAHHSFLGRGSSDPPCAISFAPLVWNTNPGHKCTHAIFLYESHHLHAPATTIESAYRVLGS